MILARFKTEMVMMQCIHLCDYPMYPIFFFVFCVNV